MGAGRGAEGEPDGPRLLGPGFGRCDSGLAALRLLLCPRLPPP